MHGVGFLQIDTRVGPHQELLSPVRTKGNLAKGVAIENKNLKTQLLIFSNNLENGIYSFSIKTCFRVFYFNEF
jgi:hypothetical protein